MNVKEQIIQECVNVIKRQDVKEEINLLVKPILEMLLNEVYPYLYILIIFMVLCFIISFINLILLYKGKYLSHGNI